MNYQSKEILKVIEINKENIKNETGIYQSSNKFYGFLFKTGQYLECKDYHYQQMKKNFELKILLINKGD